MKPLARKSLRVALALSLALANGAVAALGLGQIELKSSLGQPLLAEIPIISSDPAELDQLQAGLPSPETFARIGLQLPDEFVSSLQFTPGVDAAGRPVIRVTSAAPVTDPLLTFLVEVDWGQGRLVREYSALVDAPRTVSAPVQPTIEEATVALANTIEREVVATGSKAGDSDPAPVTVMPGDNPAVARANAVPSTRTASMASSTHASGTAPRVGAEYGPVKSGETLSRIAARIGDGSGHSVEQTMVALLRANPGAFIGGNVNLLREGAVLRLKEDEAAAVDAAEATALIRAQTQAWRAETRRPIQQAAEAASAGNSASPPVEVAGTTQASSVAGRRTADARLEIVPPGASSAKRAGTQSGIQAGGEGEMLRQELQQTQETLAARDAEVAEMKARIDELEKLQAQQQQLISMKDTELSAAQKRLADARKAEAKQQPAAEAGVGSTPWLLGGAVLLLAGMAGWWINRRRGNRTAASFRETVSAPKGPSLADAFGSAAGAGWGPTSAPVAPPPALTPESPTAGATRHAPAWHTQADAVPPDRAPHAEATSAASPASLLGGGAERLELARAYVDLGDQQSARSLLAEVLADSDASLREQAERMLRELD